MALIIKTEGVVELEEDKATIFGINDSCMGVEYPILPEQMFLFEKGLIKAGDSQEYQVVDKEGIAYAKLISPTLVMSLEENITDIEKCLSMKADGKSDKEIIDYVIANSQKYRK